MGFISCVAVGDVLNQNNNSLVVVTTEGWCYIYNNTIKKENEEEIVEDVQEGAEQVLEFIFNWYGRCIV